MLRKLYCSTDSWCFWYAKGPCACSVPITKMYMYVYYRKRGSASCIVREVRSVREREREREREIRRERERERERDTERERERERERDGSDVTLVALKLAMNFAPFLAKNLHLSIGEEFCTFLALPKNCTLVSPLLKGAEFTLSVAKNVALFETVRVLRFASVKWGDMESKHRNKRSTSACTVLLLTEKMNQINTKNYWK